MVPKFSRVSDDEYTIISRREYVSEIYGPALVDSQPQSFVLQSYNINPGLEKTFPWLSQIAANYEEYELQQLIFTFKSTTTESGNQVNGQVGTVIMATNYNAAAGTFHEKNVMMQYAGSASNRLTETLLHGVECNPRKLSGSPGSYIRTNPVVSGQDLKSYDHGLFQIAIANCTANLANQSLGELWVSYTVKLRKPKFYTSLGLGITKDIWRNNPNELSPPCTTKDCWRNNSLRGQQNSLGCLVQDSTTSGFTVITFPATYSGNVQITLLQTIETGAFNSASVSSQGNITLIRDMYGNDVGGSTGPSSNQMYVFNNCAVFIVHASVSIATNGEDNILKLGWAHTTGTGVHPVLEAYCEIGEYNAGFSYAATNIGTSMAPVWVDSSKTIVVA